MDDVIDVGDKVILSYPSRFGTGRKAVVNGTVVRVDDEVIGVRMGITDIVVPWVDVIDVRFA